MKLHTINEYVEESIFEAKKIDLKKLIGKSGEDYSQRKGTIVAAAFVRDWEKLTSYDSSGWMDKKTLYKEYQLSKDDVLVAFKVGNETDVYTFGGGGVELIGGASAEVDIWTRIGPHYEALYNALISVKKQTIDPTWKKSMGTLEGMLTKFEDKAGEFGSKLGVVPIKESINEGKFKKDDVVYNTRTKTVGIVRIGDDKSGEVKTDADGNVDVDELEKYNPIANNHHKRAKTAPSTQKEIATRGLNESSDSDDECDEMLNEEEGKFRYSNSKKGFQEEVSRMRTAYDKEGVKPEKKKRLAEWLKGAQDHKKKMTKQGWED